MKVGLLVIATGKYISFVEPLRDSVEKYFFKKSPAQVTIFVFTDSSTVPDRTVKLYKEHKKFPYPTLTRYHSFHQYRKELSAMDYLFYCDVDMKFVGPVGKEILSDLTATLHPGFYNKDRRDFSYEIRKTSTAYVSPHEGKHYFCGGFNGGKTATFLKMAATISQNIDHDRKKGIVAVWHDESHLNRYLIGHPPKKILSPSYCYPEELSLPFEPKLVALKKNHEVWRYSGWEKLLRKLGVNLVRILVMTKNKLGRVSYFSASLRLKIMRDFPEIWLDGFYHKNLSDVRHFNCREVSFVRGAVDLVVVAFNNPQIIETQVKFLRKNLQDRFYYTVADNSGDQNVRQQIQAICRRQKVGYVSLPVEPFGKVGSLGSLSHGAAMTWMYRNFLQKRKTRYFGFLDHDIFPYRRTSLLKFFKMSPVFGAKQYRREIWYLWAGFCFFDKNFVANKKLNFLSGKFGGERVDTGGVNWERLYKFMDKSSLPDFKHTYLNLTGGKIAQHDWVEFFGDWLHLFNASNWYKMDAAKQENREHLIKNLIKKYAAKK